MLDFKLTKKQKLFIDAAEDEVFYGGAAGGGKSYAQCIDDILKALQYNGIKQLILRRTFPELERSLIRTYLSILPKQLYSYNSSKHILFYNNGSITEFGYCENEKDVFKYMSAEYDIIRFDEATHFSDYQYTYLLSRLRGANKFPKQAKSSSNPGNVGHAFFKERFIEGNIPMQQFSIDNKRTRIFIPSTVFENKFLMDADPDYIDRLKELPETEQRALLYGDWDIFEGQYFREFRRDIHVIEPFVIPADWRRYRVLDYGLDMLACYWIAISTDYNAYVYKELYQSNLIISDAANKIKELTNEDIYQTLAPPDLWNRRQDTGKSAADIFKENGVTLVKSINDRILGWYNMKEWLKPYESFDEQTGEDITTSKLKITNNCTNLIRCIPLAQHDEKDANDIANEPHEITHSLDALRYFCAYFAKPSKPEEQPITGHYFKRELIMRGYKEHQIKKLVKSGNVKLLGE